MKLKKTIIIIGLFTLLFVLSAFTYDYLDSSTATATATTSGDDTWSDVVSTTLDVTTINNVLVVTSINMWAQGSSSNGREVHYRLDCNGTISGALNRQVQLPQDGDDSGMGSLVHIFDVSGTSGVITIKLEHANFKGGDERNVTSQAVLNVIALTTHSTNQGLNNQFIELSSEEGTTSSTFAAVSGLSTTAINLPLDGEFYVAASIGARASAAGPTGEWGLQYSPNNSDWSNIGQPVQRNMSNTADDGMISLVALAQNLTAGNYYFRVVHRKVSGINTVYTTAGSSIATIALSYENGGNKCCFPTFYTLNATGDVSSSSSYETSASTTFLTNNDISSEEPDLLIHAQFNMTGNAAMFSEYQFGVTGTTSWSGVEQQRYIASTSDVGSGVLIGLAENISGGETQTITLKHKISDYTSGNELTSNNIILTGFQLFNDDAENPVPVELTSFIAKSYKNGTILNWSTATEVNNYGFDIEKKSIGNWAKIGFVEGHGNSNSPKDYSFVDSSPVVGEVSYRLKQIDTDGVFEYSDVVTVTSTNLAMNELHQNHPNPFNPSTVISFSLAELAHVNITIYNAIGQKVADLANEQMDAGFHNVNFDASGLSSGFYFYHLETPNYSKTMKMILIR